MTASNSDQFASLNLAAAQLTNLAALGFAAMTPVQARCLPLVLQGKDVIAQARTGSGKTVAFGLGLLQRIDARSFNVQALVLCPTRELADQVSRELRRLAQGVGNIKLVTLCGGKPAGPQKASLRHGAHIVVGTPGRVLDHLRKGALQPGSIGVVVLDEADRMLDMGFADDVVDIVERTPRQRQTLLFSATYPPGIEQMSRNVQREPVRITVEPEHLPGVIEQLFYAVRADTRDGTLLALLQHYKPESALVFCQTRQQCREVATLLCEQRVDALALHGDLDQRARDGVLVRFANGSVPVLVATDVAARGLDIAALQLVINYELPRDPEVYTHRIGRTGRAGASGTAVSMFTQAEQPRLSAIEANSPQPCLQDVPASLDRNPDYELRGKRVTVEISAGRKQKLRPGDLLGALTGEGGIPGAAVGKIVIFDWSSFVALDRSVLRQALKHLNEGKVKGRKLRARTVS